ncbi:hypothetical protein [Flagellimonas sp.]|uniref:hypothetical protein n=1 Tax=Flagellimonas sp. TaxID=2058762 RepID=UPI003B59E48D
MTIEVFFYGLFMDQTILSKNGIVPSNPRKGHLNNYALKIGNRASLIPSKGEQSYGIVLSCDADTIRKLYSEASVADYIPEQVEVITEPNGTVQATGYNLPSELLTGTNTAYAESLYILAKQKGFPENYLEKIKKMG